MLLGRPIATEEAPHQLLPKILALPVFASDALSSVAYATEEILIVLIAAGTSALRLSVWIAVAIAVLMAIVIASYRQTVHAYPGGGGAYIVAHENLGEMPGLVAAAALLTDYVLTVAVSIAAGAFALGSLSPGLLEHRVGLSLGFILVISVANLRGARESGTLFALPTYAFIFSVLAMIGLGVGKCLSACPQIERLPPIEYTPHALGLYLVLRAFASGSTALTGVEAIANGVPAFRGRRPAEQAQNAATTLAMLGGTAITMFIGMTYLANRMGARPSDLRSIVAQIAHATFGGGFGFVAVQIATALILVLAANTAYQDFPRLSSILARDRYMPRQFINRGDRLGFSNGIIALALLASALIVLFHAEVTRLIQLYVVGVFTSFTLSQAGMLRRWRRLRAQEPRWRRRAALNTIGGITTGVVLVVVAWVKFSHGAWIVLVAIPLIVTAFKIVNRHYGSVAVQLRVPEERPKLIGGLRAVVVAPALDESTRRAIGYARALHPIEIRAVHVGAGPQDEALAAEWRECCPGTRLDLLPLAGRGEVAAIREYVRGLPRAEDEVVSVIIPEAMRGAGWRQFVRRRSSLALRGALLFEPGVSVTDFPNIPGQSAIRPSPAGRAPIAPARVAGVVLVSAVHNATLRALAYARALGAADLRAVTFNVDPEESSKVMSDWSRWGIDFPLEIIDSPYREVRRPLLRYLKDIRDARPGTIVSVIVPEFVVSKWWQQFLHNQTALAIRASLLFAPDIVVTSVPFHLR
ncbi:MAG: APC family permease [Acidobacteria bacterium]|nr:APC family permease [Acidobacteriota bacterium]